MDTAGEEHLPALVRFADEARDLREESVGFLPSEAAAEILAMTFHTTRPEKWGFRMEYCRGQAYIVSTGCPSETKVVASRLLEKHPSPSCLHTLLFPVPEVRGRQDRCLSRERLLRLEQWREFDLFSTRHHNRY